MPTKYFSKLSPRLPIALSNGAFQKFESVSPNLGAVKTDDPEVIAGLTAYLGSGRGGVSEITETEYADLLKKKFLTENTSRKSSQIIETQTSGLVNLPGQPKTPSPTLSEVASPAVTEPAPLAEPPPIKLGKVK